MNLFKPKFRDRKTGQLLETPRWYCDFRDHLGIRQRFRGSEDKHESKALGRMLEDLVRCRKRKVQPKDKLWQWLMGLEPDVQKRLVKIDLADKKWFVQLSQAERLSSWVDEYAHWLRTSKGRNGYRRNQTYIEVTLTRVRNIVKGCGFKTWTDVAKSRIESFLGGLDIQVGTYNGYVTSFKQFCMWCVRDGKATHSPVQFLDRVRASHKESRRPLSFDETCRLLETTANSPEHHGLTGEARAILYLVAITTGYRANELRSLTVGCFDFDKATVRLDAKHCKDRRNAVQMLPLSVAGRLTDFLADRDSMEPAFGLLTNKTAAMLKKDAVAAGLPIVDAEGRELVFHSTRHTLRTELVKARVTESVVDAIMRHKPVGVGQRFYSHVTDFEKREAVERLPEYPWPGELIQQAKKEVS